MNKAYVIQRNGQDDYYNDQPHSPIGFLSFKPRIQEAWQFQLKDEALAKISEILKSGNFGVFEVKEIYVL